MPVVIPTQDHQFLENHLESFQFPPIPFLVQGLWKEIKKANEHDNLLLRIFTKTKTFELKREPSKTCWGRCPNRPELAAKYKLGIPHPVTVICKPYTETDAIQGFELNDLVTLFISVSCMLQQQTTLSIEDHAYAQFLVSEIEHVAYNCRYAAFDIRDLNQIKLYFHCV